MNIVKLPCDKELWLVESKAYVACVYCVELRTQDEILQSGDWVYRERKIRPASMFELISGELDTEDWNYKNNGGFYIRREVQIVDAEEMQLNLF